MIQVTPVILCGGSGTRLWPLSRTGFPKQFLCLTGNESLFQQAALRLANLGSPDIQVADPFIVTGEDHRFLASEQLREISVELGCALLEPVGRNTAPALTLAALAAIDGGADPVLVVTPADQTVTKAEVFTTAVQQAVAEAANGTIVILGVKPDNPETGYGYIQTRPRGRDPLIANVLDVTRFVEKPDAATAQIYLNDGGYYWNAGMFVLKASVWLKALKQFRTDILQATQDAWDKRSADNTFVRPGKAEFAAIPSESVDYAAMEHCPGSNFPIKMVPLEAGWNDLGAWDAVWNVLPKDDNGNAHLGDVLSTDSKNTLVHATNCGLYCGAHRCRVSNDREILAAADVLVLPGVGAFPAAMSALHRDGLASYLCELARQGKPFVGLCLGMQLLADESLEHGTTAGLGLIPGTVRPLPGMDWHIGWNSLETVQHDPLMAPSDGESFYFNHSHVFAVPAPYQAAICRAQESSFTVAVRRGNVVGLQFHPEKSQAAGKQLLSRLVEGLGHA